MKNENTHEMIELGLLGTHELSQRQYADSLLHCCCKYYLSSKQ